MSDRGSEPSLTLRDRINFPYIVAKLLLLIQEFNVTQFAEKELVDAVRGFVSGIPDQMKDAEFRKDEQKATITYNRDIRPSWCGELPSFEICEEYGIPALEKATTLDPYKMLQAIMNLLDRKHMVTRKQFIEKFTGIPFMEEILSAEIETDEL